MPINKGGAGINLGSFLTAHFRDSALSQVVDSAIAIVHHKIPVRICFDPLYSAQ